MKRDKNSNNSKPKHKPFRIDGGESFVETKHVDFISDITDSKPFDQNNSPSFSSETQQIIDTKPTYEDDYNPSKTAGKFSLKKLPKFLKIKKFRKPEPPQESSNLKDLSINSTPDQFQVSEQRSEQTSKTSPLKFLNNFIWITKIFVNFSSKTIRFSLLTVVLILALAVSIPKTFDNSDLNFYLAQKATKLLDANFSIKGEIEIALLPRPTLILNDVFIENYKDKTTDQEQKILNLYFKNLKIAFPIFSFFSKKPINKISGNDALIEVWQENAIVGNVAESKFKNLLINIAKEPKKEEKNEASEQIVVKSGPKAKIFSIDDFEKLINSQNIFPNIDLHDCELDFFDKSGIYRQIKNINAEIKIDEDYLSANGLFSSEDVTSKFDLLLTFNSKSSKPDSHLKINSDMLDLEIVGNFPSKNEGVFSDFKGSASAEIKNFKKFYRSFFANNDSLAQNLSEAVNDVKINAEINNQSHEINIKDLSINSSAVNGKITLTADRPKELVIIDLKADIDNLNIDNFWINGGYQSEARLGPIDGINFNNLPNVDDVNLIDENSSKDNSDKIKSALAKVSKNIDLAAELNFKKITFKETEIKDASLYATITNKGKISISPLLFHLGDNSVFRLNGVIDNNEADWKFVGNFDAAGEDFGGNLKWVGFESDNLKFDSLKKFRLYSDIAMGQYGSRFNRLYLNLNQGESEIIGEIKISNSSSGRIIATNLIFDRLKLENYFLLTKKNSYFSSGSLIKKLIWLNEINDYHDIRLRFNNLQYGDQELSNQSFTMSLGRGYAIIPNTEIITQDNKLNFDLAIDIAEKKQNLKLNLKANRLTINPSELKGSNDSSTKNQENFFDLFYNLPSVEKFDGNIAIKVDELLIDDRKFENVSLTSGLRNGALNPAQLKMDLYGGTFEFQGAAQLASEKVVNGSFSLNNAELSTLLKDLFDIEGISGISNIAGNITSNATQKSDFLARLKSEVSFSTNRPTIIGLGINDLVRKMFQLDVYRNELNNPEKIIFNDNGKTVFKEAKGFFSIKNGSDGKFKVKLNAPAVNSVFFGNFAAANQSFDGSLNTIFLTGNAERQLPLNIAINLKYQPKNLIYINNLDQVRQYLGLTKIKPEAIIISKDASVKSEANSEVKKLETPETNLSKSEFDKVAQDIENSNTIRLPTAPSSLDSTSSKDSNEQMPTIRLKKSAPTENRPQPPSKKDPMSGEYFNKT